MSWKAVGWIAVSVTVGWSCSLAMAQHPADGSLRWPVQVQTSAGQVTVFQPQVEDLQADLLSARAVVSVQGPDGQAPVFGCVWIQSHISTDRGAGTVQILDVNITRSRFPDAALFAQQAVTDGVRQVFTAHRTTLSLDHLLKTLDIVHKAQAAAAQLQDTPPQIIFLDHPAAKVQYDGQPRLVEVTNSSLLRVVNTPFFVALDPGTKLYYLKGGGAWFSATDPLGPFHHESNVPQGIAALADSTGYQDPQQPLTADQADNIEIVTATDPTELICTDGPAQMGIIPGTQLLYFSNTSSDVFLHIDSQQLYVLISGRWYTAAGRKGPWTNVSPDQLPDDFARIPRDSARSNVLVDVAGTKAAQDAVDDASVPQIAAVDLNHFDPPPVQYDGQPIFQPIQGTDLSYATNTDAAVIVSGGTYYCCHNAVWYSGSGSSGPWQICTSVPSEIYTIPPSCPIYSVRFCYVYGRAADVCYVGYLPGYLGSYASNGVVVYGTGYYYQPWIGRNYFVRPDSFGFGARYDASSGQWGFGFAVNVGGGGGWVGSANRHEDHPWFGNGGYHADHLEAGRHVDNKQGQRSAEAPTRVDVYGNRRDVRGELGPMRGGSEPVARPEQRDQGDAKSRRTEPPAPSGERPARAQPAEQSPSGAKTDHRGKSGGDSPSPAASAKAPPREQPAPPPAADQHGSAPDQPASHSQRHSSLPPQGKAPSQDQQQPGHGQGGKNTPGN